MNSTTKQFSCFGGVDFSGAREPLANLWSAVGVEREGRLKILSLRPHAFRADLAAYVADGWRQTVARNLPAGNNRNDDHSILWGLDFPFGLPLAASAAMGAGTEWNSIIAWVADRPPDEVRSAAADAARTLRVADSGGALPPLDLRLYKQTVEGLRWLHELRDAAHISIHPQNVAHGAPVTLIEVYPSGTARELGLPRRRAPARPGEFRARAAALRTFIDFPDPDCEAIAVNLEDAWDATIACLTAYLCRCDLDQPVHAGPAASPVIEHEGWIYRPPATRSI